MINAAAEEHIHAVTAALDEPTAITAAGGLGPFLDTDHSLAGFETNARPIKGALPSFGTTRGGIRFARPPKLGDLVGSAGVWTLEDDVAAATNPAVRKPILRVLPGPEVVVNLQAITSRLLIGNLLARTYPEHVARFTDLGVAFHSKISKQQLVTQIGALSTAVTGSANEADTPPVGATRVLLPMLERAAVGMRNRLRMPSTAVLQLFLPDWARGLLRSDLTRQEPGDANSESATPSSRPT
jgi:hypothetical protein